MQIANLNSYILERFSTSNLVSHVQLKTFDIAIVKHHRLCCYILTAQRFPLAAFQLWEIPALL